MRQLGDERLGHSVCEEFLLRIAGKVLKWKHRQRVDPFAACGMSSDQNQTCDDDRDGHTCRQQGPDPAVRSNWRLFCNGCIVDSLTAAAGRFGIGWARHGLNGCDETAASPRKSLDEPRGLGRVTEGGSNARNRVVKPVLEIDKRIGGPELFP